MSGSSTSSELPEARISVGITASLEQRWTQLHAALKELRLLLKLDTAQATRDYGCMRLSRADMDHIRAQVSEIAGPSARVRLFGSRVDDAARGGDVDLLVELPLAVERPALLSALLSARISRALLGRGVDVLLTAPNLERLPIHRHALAQGIPL